jgi:hypothetical protein
MTTSGSRTNIFVIVLFAFLLQPKSPAATKLKFKLSVPAVPSTTSTKIPNVINPNEKITTKNNWEKLLLDGLKVKKNKSKSILHFLISDPI